MGFFEIKKIIFLLIRFCILALCFWPKDFRGIKKQVFVAYSNIYSLSFNYLDNATLNGLFDHQSGRENLICEQGGNKKNISIFNILSKKK